MLLGLFLLGSEVKAASVGTQFTVSDVKYEILSDSTVRLIDGSACNGDYVIPSNVTYEGVNYQVTELGNKAFCRNYALTSVAMPSTITTLQDGVTDSDGPCGTFNSCISLEEVTLSENLEYIGKSAFLSCDKLANVTLPNKLSFIGEGAFNGCTAITEIKLPASLQQVGQCAFSGTSIKEIYVPATAKHFHVLAVSGIDTLERIDFQEGHAYFASKDGVMYDYDYYTLRIYPPAKKDETYTIDSRTKAIQMLAFEGNKYLKTLIFSRGQNVEYFGAAFLQDSNVEEFGVTDDNYAFKAVDGVLYSKDGKTLYLYPPAKKDKIFFVPSGVENIGNLNVSTFATCQYLEELYIPASVKTFDGIAWGSPLKRVGFASESQITSLPGSMFQDCYSLQNICLPKSMKSFSSDYYGNEFLDCYSLKTLYAPSGAGIYSCEYFGAQSLAGCYDVTTVYGHGTDNALSNLAEQFNCAYVDVSTGYDSVLGVTFTDTSIPMSTGGQYKLQTVVYPENTTAKEVTYESSNESIAKVASDGTVTAVGVGTCYITATATDGSNEFGRCQIVVDGKSITEQEIPQNGWLFVDGERYWYENGVKQGTEGRGKEIYDGVSDAWYWLDAPDGKMAFSKDVYQESLAGQWGDYIGEDGERYGKWVRYDRDGQMVKGWQLTEIGNYFFDYTYGTMAKGYATIDKEEYYFNKDTGVLEEVICYPPENGWMPMDGIYYWFENYTRQGYSVNESYRGKEIFDPESNAWYWLDNVQNGAKAVSKDVYQESLAGQWGDYVGADGERYGKWVRYDKDGHMIKGWDTNENGTYYFDPIYGTMAKGEAVIEGMTYYFDVNTGVLQY